MSKIALKYPADCLREKFSCFSTFIFYRTCQLNQIEKLLFVVSDVDGYDTIKKSLDDLKDETDKWLKSNFEQWRDKSLALISTGDLK